MADFRIDDHFTMMLVTPQTEKAKDWIEMFMCGLGHYADGFMMAPGFAAHKLVPAMREAGFTADGDVDEGGNVRLRVQT